VKVDKSADRRFAIDKYAPRHGDKLRARSTPGTDEGKYKGATCSEESRRH
jgi:hypothetical protein